MDTNMDNRRVRILQLGILALNVVSVMGLSIFIYATIENIRRSYVAREFLSGIQAIVWYPYRNIWICALLLALLAGSMFVRDRLFPDNSKVILFSLVADFAICFAIIILLNFNYNGILLLVFSNVILYAKTGNPDIFWRQWQSAASSWPIMNCFPFPTACIPYRIISHFTMHPPSSICSAAIISWYP